MSNAETDTRHELVPRAANNVRLCFNMHDLAAVAAICM